MHFILEITNIVSIILTNNVSCFLLGDVMPRTGLSKEEIVEKAAELANEKGLSYLSVTTL